MRVLFHAAAASTLLIVSGCAREKIPSPASSRASAAGAGATNAPSTSRNVIVTPEHGLDGTVTWVNANLRFVVVTFPVGQMPALEQRLSVYRRELKVGEVKITGPQRGDNIVADITTGEAGAGDSIREK